MKIRRLAGLMIAVFAMFSAVGCATKADIDRAMTRCATKADIDQAIYKSLHPIAVDDALLGQLYPRRPLDGDQDDKLTGKEVTRWAQRTFKKELERADSNDDGKLSAAELNDARTNGPGARIRSGMDADGNGVITLQEHSKYVGAIIADILKKYDRDGDGAISETEFVSEIERSVARLDTDKNAVLERRELRPEQSQQPRAKQSDRALHTMICGPICVWDLPAGDYGGEVDSGGPNCAQNPGLAGCPSGSHPGCTNGDVSSGNCTDIWPDHSEPFFK